MELTKEMLSEIIVDKGYEPYMYMDQQYVNYPSVFPCVRLQLVDTNELCRLADKQRISEGAKPFFSGEDADEDGYYDFFIEINGFSKISNVIDVNAVINNGESIDELSLDIPDSISDALYERLQEQIDCDGLLKECEKRFKE